MIARACTEPRRATPPRGAMADGKGSWSGSGASRLRVREAADMAHEAGAAVESNVNKTTTLLVVGDEDIDRLNGQDRSSKHRKAEKLIKAGQPLRTLGEADFMSVCRT